MGGRRGRSRASGEENEALQFGLVLVELAPAPGVEWSRLAPAAALGGPGRPQWRWTGRHLAAPPGLGRAGGSAWAPLTARSSGWASAVLPGCLGRRGRRGRSHHVVRGRFLFQPSGNCGAVTTLRADGERMGLEQLHRLARPRGTGLTRGLWSHCPAPPCGPPARAPPPPRLTGWAPAHGPRGHLQGPWFSQRSQAKSELPVKIRCSGKVT